ELSLSPSQQGLLASSVLFGNLIFEIPINWWFSRYRPWRISIVSFAAAGLFVAFNGWAPTFAVLIIARVGLGVVYLSTQAPRTLVILQWIPRKHIGLANGVMFSILEAFEGAGYIAIPLILVWSGDWRTTLYAWAVVCMVASGLWFFVGRDRDSSDYRERIRSQVKTPLGSLFKYKEPWLLGLGVAGAVSSRFAIGTFWPTYTGDEYGTSVMLAGSIIGLMAIASAPTMLGVSVFPIFVRHTSTLLVICGIGLSATYSGILFTGSLPLLFLLGIANGMTFSFFPAVMTRLYGLPGIRPREVAVAVALIYTLLWGGAALGPLVAGFVQEATDDLRLALVITSMTSLSLSIVGLLLSGKGRRAAEPSLAPVAEPR
ncbi:MAG: MFS transporter, partial [Dehalococcoidia bacterium]